MSFSVIFLIIFLTLLYAVSFVASMATLEIYKFFLKITKKDNVAKMIIAILYFPGTLLHESAHAISATFLLLKVRSFSVFPVFEKNGIKLGYVTYEKRDFFRSILVGVSPVFFGVALIFYYAYFSPFTHSFSLLTVLLGYLFFAVTGSMFSSKSDMKDAGYLIPLIVFLFLIGFIFKEHLNFLVPVSLEALDYLVKYLYYIVWYVLGALVLHFFIYIIFKLFLKLLHGR